MKIKQLIENDEFQKARLEIYFILFTSYIVVAYLIHIKCIGCPLCGMTRAVKSLLRLDFKSAFEFNSMVWIFCIAIPIIIIDIVMILKKKYKKM